MRKLSRIALGGALLALLSCGHAPVADTEKLDLNWSAIHLPPYPADDSQETRQELAELLRLQDQRTPEQVREIIAQNEKPPTDFAGFKFETVHETLPKNASAVSRYMTTALDPLVSVIFPLKASYHRTRPTKLEPKLHPAVPVPWHASYPSGHSTQAHIVALLLSRLEPSASDRLWALADRIGKNREIAGLHYPSDTRGGIILARQYTDLLFQNPRFVQLFEKAQAEWKAGGPNQTITWYFYWTSPNKH